MKFQENKIENITLKLSVNDDLSDVEEPIRDIGKIYSCIVYGCYNNNLKLTGWDIRLNISQTNKFNTLKANDVISYITNKMQNSKDSEPSHVICYMQPSVELIIKLFKPLIIKLAREQQQRWQHLEMEDLIQMCNLVICDLYYKNYYIHKRLIRRSFINYVLMHIRKDKNRPVIVSFEQEYSKSDDDDKLTIGDMIPDTKMVDELDTKDDYEVHCRILEEVKDIVIDFIGPRQYDQLLREYSNKSTTNWSRKLMVKIKAHLFEMGITNKSYYKYYN